MSNYLQPHGLSTTRLLCPWNFPGKNTGVGCFLLLQIIFPIQGSNLHFLLGRLILYHWETHCSLLFLLKRPVMSDSLQPHVLQHARPPCPSPSPRVCPSSCPLHQWCHPAMSSSEALFSFCPLSFPASQTFAMSRLFASDDKNTRTSAQISVLPVNIRGWCLLRLTDLISLLSKGLFQESSPAPQFEGINFSALCFLYHPALTTRHDCWEDDSLDHTDLCQQSNVSAF